MKQYISPLDNRYYDIIGHGGEYFSEFSLMKYRIYVEVLYLLSFIRITKINAGKLIDEAEILKITQEFNENDYQRIKQLEEKTRHDIKAVEYFLKEKLSTTKLLPFLTFIHFGLTSEDTNNIAYSLIIKKYLNEKLFPVFSLLIKDLSQHTSLYKNVIMPGRTHGQKAVPTTMGKELAIYLFRLNKVFNQLKKTPIEAKLNGAVGNYNALIAVYPKINWTAFSQNFIEKMDLTFNPLSTQIEPADSYYDLFSNIKHLNLVLIGFCQDIWRYISDGYLKLNTVKEEAGSSTMPQKVNPINFENAEGNFKIANSLLSLFTDNLVISRLQRDLSDSTIKRNIGVAFAHTELALTMIINGLKKITVDKEQIQSDLNSDYSLILEGVQIILRHQGYPNGYELTKELTRGKRLNPKDYLSIIKKMPIDQKTKLKLSKLNPENYIGLAIELCQ